MTDSVHRDPDSVRQVLMNDIAPIIVDGFAARGKPQPICSVCGNPIMDGSRAIITLPAILGDPWIWRHFTEPLIAECDGCGADITEGTPHDCPVLGTTVTISKEKP